MSPSNTSSPQSRPSASLSHAPWFPRCLLVLTAILASPLAAEETYPVHPDAIVTEGVPRGRIESFEFVSPKIYPGTRRQISLYIPAQYNDAAPKPAAVMVFQDGPKYVRKNSSWALPTVFDNLIHRGDMPVTIAICVAPGVVESQTLASDPSQMGRDRYNRSYEYDSVSDRYARFLVEEVLPRVSQSYSLTDDPNRRGIGGSSSGAIAALGAAWHRPDQFRRVFSTVGTFVGLRGGNEFPTLVRKTEPKPIKVFLQDGRNDLNIYGGSWWAANQTMLSALQWGGYQVRHVWGDGGHNGKHGSAIFPDAMKWLWADADKPISSPRVSDHVEWKHWLVDGETWTRDSAPFPAAAKPGRAVARPARPANPTASSQTPDGQFLLVASDRDRHVWSHQITPDGRLRFGQPYGYLHTPQTDLRTGASAMTMTRDGEPLVATTLGIQCFDQPGRVHLIIDSPSPGEPVNEMRLVGHALHVRIGDRHYRRTLAVEGIAEGETLVPPKPRL